MNSKISNGMNTKRTSLFLMANLGAEASRIISAAEYGDLKLAKDALVRAELIMKQVKDLPEMKPREKEMDALADALRAITVNNSKNRVSPKHIKSYFIPFAIRMLTART